MPETPFQASVPRGRSFNMHRSHHQLLGRQSASVKDDTEHHKPVIKTPQTIFAVLLPLAWLPVCPRSSASCCARLAVPVGITLNEEELDSRDSNESASL